MNKIFLLQTFYKKYNEQNKKITLRNIAKKNTPEYIKELYNILISEIFKYDILKKDLLKKELFGINIKIDDDLNSIINENDSFFEILNKIAKNNTNDLDIDFEIMLNIEIEKIPSTIIKMIKIVIASINLEFQEIKENLNENKN